MTCTDSGTQNYFVIAKERHNNHENRDKKFKKKV